MTVPATDSAARSTANPEYAKRLKTLQGAWWKRALDVQRPYRWNLHRLDLGKTLDVGCGIGRNLKGRARGSSGIDHNAECVSIARAAGMAAFLPNEFPGGVYDSVLFAHVLEHLSEPSAQSLVREYVRFVRPGGKVVFITPQEAGYRTDPTHVTFVDFNQLNRLAQSEGLSRRACFSFPLPRAFGRIFPYNEFVLVATTPH